MPASIAAGPEQFTAFSRWLADLDHGTVLELGTRKVDGRPSTLRRDWVPSSNRYIASDFQAGDDVDVVADVESLSETFPVGTIDAVIACSVFEHIRRPWIAAEEIGKVLRPGGRVFIQTHNCFPIHAHPFDYWRFTREALESLFSDDLGFTNRWSWYDFPAAIVSARDPVAAGLQAFLNVSLLAERRQ